MRVLICTDFNLINPSAGLTKMKKVRDSLKLYGVKTYISGFTEENIKVKNVDDENIIFHLPKNKFLPLKFWKNMFSSVYFYKKNLDQILKEFYIDCVIIYSTFSTVIEPLTKICKRNNVKVTAYVGEFFSFSAERFLKGVLFMQNKAFSQSMRHLDGLICASPAWELHAKNLGISSVLLPTFAEENINKLIPNGISNKMKFRILVISNLSNREYPAVIFKTMRILQNKKINAELYVIGKRPKLTLFNLNSFRVNFHLLGLRNIFFTGFIDNSYRNNLMLSADCFTLLRAANMETKYLFPVRIGEYFAAAKPVILSFVEPFSLYFKHKKEVYFISKENRPEDLFQAILKLKNDKILQESIGNNSKKYSTKYYSNNYLGDKLFQFLNDLIYG